MTRQRIRNRGRGRRSINEANRRWLQSRIAIAINAQMAKRRMKRNRVGERVRRIKAGNSFVDIIERYLKTAGIEGTIGKAENIGQAIAGGTEFSTKSIQKNQFISIPNLTSNISLMSCKAFLASIPSEKVYDNILSSNLLILTFEKIVFRWELLLLKGNYNIFILQDSYYPMINGVYPIFGISTERYSLEKFKYDLLLTDGKIKLWKNIRGKKPFPKLKKKVKALMYDTIKQG